MTGLKVTTVNVHVQGINTKMENEEESKEENNEQIEENEEKGE